MRLLIVLLAATFPAAAVAQSGPEGKALQDFLQCVDGSVGRFAVLDQPLSDIAEVAIAACFPSLDGFRRALEENVNVNQRAAYLAFAKEQARGNAMLKAAEAKLLSAQ